MRVESRDGLLLFALIRQKRFLICNLATRQWGYPIVADARAVHFHRGVRVLLPPAVRRAPSALHRHPPVARLQALPSVRQRLRTRPLLDRWSRRVLR
jgi:hypothetical protein